MISVKQVQEKFQAEKNMLTDKANMHQCRLNAAKDF